MKWKTNVRDKCLLDGRSSLSRLSPQETYLIPRFSLDGNRKNDNKLPVQVFVWMRIRLSTGSWFVAFVPNTGACFDAFVPKKYWSSACRLCAKLPMLGLLPSIVIACPNYRWLCFRCMLMCRVSCRCHCEWNAIMWLDVLRGLSIDGCMNYDVLQKRVRCDAMHQHWVCMCFPGNFR
jgi:hypothetical protein